MNCYNEFIHKSRYSRFLDEEGRRESWEETVDRFFTFMKKSLKERNNYDIPEDLHKELRGAFLAREVVPSMRAVMTAGPALERSHVAAYNCSYIAIDDPKAFDEAMYVLLSGTGVGFSAEQKYVNKLPEIPDKLFESDTTIVVPDSKEGWAKSLRMLIAMLYAGEIPVIDYSKIRPAGARLKTFGGRASGPKPLSDLFRFVINKFRKAVGRKLHTIEAHDIMCKIGQVVVVGGVRRSALISLSDLGDDKIAHAKVGEWWETHPHRALANNSAVYDEKPPIGAFMREWYTLYSSRSGERGIFNRAASSRQAARNGRRITEGVEFGTNPCSEIILRPNQFCNLSSVVVLPTDTLDDLERKIRLASVFGTFQATLTNFPYLRKIWKKNTEEEALLGVSMTGVLDHHLLNDPEDPDLPARLQRLRDAAVEVNKRIAPELGIKQAAAVTAIKPEGTVSQLCGVSSGLHPQHAKYYIRRVRGDNKDPLTTFMKDAGFDWEPCAMNPGNTTVFSFPMKAPEEALVRSDLDAIKHLKLWMVYQKHYCEHKPSVTITVGDDEWLKVADFTYDNFDEFTGVSFLPDCGGSYQQMPFEEVSKDEYEKLVEKQPMGIDWNSFKEQTDNVEGSQTLACTAGGCEL
jgi:ribonucleoside-diphosphate reductase alpha chain